MNWEAIGAVGEAVGAAGVIVSLLYLAVQIRGDAREKRASRTHDRSVSTGNLLLTIANNPELSEIFSRGIKIEVGDLVPSGRYAELLKRVPPVWDKAFEVNASEDPAVRASCVEFVLAGLYAADRISRSQHRGGMIYESP